MYYMDSWLRLRKLRLGYNAQHPSPRRNGSQQISLDQVGWEARKIPATGNVFLLEFPPYRTYPSADKGAPTLILENRRGFLERQLAACQETQISHVR